MYHDVGDAPSRGSISMMRFCHFVSASACQDFGASVTSLVFHIIE